VIAERAYRLLEQECPIPACLSQTADCKALKTLRAHAARPPWCRATAAWAAEALRAATTRANLRVPADAMIEAQAEWAIAVDNILDCAQAPER
jgi:hypothetical protein